MSATLGLPLLIALIAVALLFDFLISPRGLKHGPTHQHLCHSPGG
jgi:hypothetical protein